MNQNSLRKGVLRVVEYAESHVSTPRRIRGPIPLCDGCATNQPHVQRMCLCNACVRVLWRHHVKQLLDR